MHTLPNILVSCNLRQGPCCYPCRMFSKFSGSSIPPPLGSPAHHGAFSNIYGCDPSLFKHLREGSKGPNAIEPRARPPSPTPAGCVSGHKISGRRVLAAHHTTTGCSEQRPQANTSRGDRRARSHSQSPVPSSHSQHSPREPGTRLPPSNLATPRPPTPRPWGARHKGDPSAQFRCSPPQQASLLSRTVHGAPPGEASGSVAGKAS